MWPQPYRRAVRSEEHTAALLADAGKGVGDRGTVHEKWLKLTHAAKTGSGRGNGTRTRNPCLQIRQLASLWLVCSRPGALGQFEAQ